MAGLGPVHPAWTGAGEWRDLAWRMAVGEDAIPLRTLGLRKIHEQPPAAAVEAWSFVSWWRATDAPGLRRFLATIRGTGDVTKSVEAARGKPAEEVERDWRQWVLVD